MTTEDDKQLRNQCIATWRKTFEELLGDAEPYLTQNVTHWQDWMFGEESKTSWFYHDTFLSYIVHELIPKDVETHLSGDQMMKLMHELELAITPPGDYPGRFAPDVDPEYDWDAVRRRVADVIAKYRR
jgi:hypothetical protein